jgi:transposase InsO family protein
MVMEETKKNVVVVTPAGDEVEEVTPANDGGVETELLEADEVSDEVVGLEGQDRPVGNETGRPMGLARSRRVGKRLVRKPETPPIKVDARQRLLILDAWKRSALPAKDFGALVGVAKQTLHSWKRRFDEDGPGGLVDGERGGRRGSKLPELTRRTILMIKEGNPEYGCQRISDMLVRGPGLSASPGAVAKVLHEGGYELEEVTTHPHEDKVRRFERARPNQLWQTDLFTFVLKRQNRRVYLCAFMDDHSRFIVGYGVYAGASTALVIEALRSGIASYGPPEEVLTDNGPQYITWRGKSQFSRELEKRGIKHVVASPKRPQTLGKVERFWGTLWRECLETAVFIDMEDARRRVGLFIDYYNFHRTHQGLDGLIPADRFFNAAPEVLRTLKERVAANALELARNGVPKKPFYLTGQVGGQGFSVHAEGERMVLTKDTAEREEIELVGPKPKEEIEELPQPVTPMADLQHTIEDDDGEMGPGESPLDAGMQAIAVSREGGGQ